MGIAPGERNTATAKAALPSLFRRKEEKGQLKQKPRICIIRTVVSQVSQMYLGAGCTPLIHARRHPTLKRSTYSSQSGQKPLRRPLFSFTSSSPCQVFDVWRDGWRIVLPLPPFNAPSLLLDNLAWKKVLTAQCTLTVQEGRNYTVVWEIP